MGLVGCVFPHNAAFVRANGAGGLRLPALARDQRLRVRSGLAPRPLQAQRQPGVQRRGWSGATKLRWPICPTFPWVRRRCRRGGTPPLVAGTPIRSTRLRNATGTAGSGHATPGPEKGGCATSPASIPPLRSLSRTRSLTVNPRGRRSCTSRSRCGVLRRPPSPPTRCRWPVGGGVCWLAWWTRSLVGLLVLIPAFPLYQKLMAAISAYMSEVIRAAQAGQTSVPTTVLTNGFTPQDQLALLAIQLGVTLLFHVVFLRWKAATPGLMVCGLRVVPLDHGSLLGQAGVANDHPAGRSLDVAGRLRLLVDHPDRRRAVSAVAAQTPDAPRSRREDPGGQDPLGPAPTGRAGNPAADLAKPKRCPLFPAARPHPRPRGSVRVSRSHPEGLCAVPAELDQAAALLPPGSRDRAGAQEVPGSQPGTVHRGVSDELGGE